MAKQVKPPKSSIGGKILREIKQDLCLKTGIDPTVLNILIDKFAIKRTKGKDEGSKNRLRNNTTSEINRSSLTIDLFFKFLDVLERAGFVKVKVSIEVTHVSGKTYTASREHDLSVDDGFVIKSKEIENEESK